MKYLFNSITKLIIFLLILSLSVGLWACNNDVDDSSVEAPTSDEESSAVLQNEVPFTRDYAIELLKQDRTATEIFVCNYLCDATSTKAERTLVPSGVKYGNFSEIEALIANTYIPESGDKEFFMSYPENQEPSVISQDGRTSVFRHSGSDYSDYADYSTVSISDTQDENIKQMSFSTLSGKALTVNVHRNAEGKWLLEKGIYRLNPPEKVEADFDLSKIGQGSFKGASGKILVIQLFVSDKKTSISPADETFFHQIVASATTKIAETVSQYGLSLQFDFDSEYFKHKGELGNRAIDFDIMLAQTNFGNLQTFAQANCDLSGYDGYFFVVCAKKEMETTFGACDGTEDTQLYYGERVIAGSSVTDLDIYKSILCLLGADPREEKLDKYTESLYGFYFPNDFAVTSDLATAELSPVTAFMCGITKELDPLYHIFIPKNK